MSETTRSVGGGRRDTAICGVTIEERATTMILVPCNLMQVVLQSVLHIPNSSCRILALHRSNFLSRDIFLGDKKCWRTKRDSHTVWPWIMMFGCPCPIRAPKRTCTYHRSSAAFQTPHWGFQSSSTLEVSRFFPGESKKSVEGGSRETQPHPGFISRFAPQRAHRF